MRRAHQTAGAESGVAGANAGLAAWRNVSRSARPEAPAPRQVRSSLLARRKLAPLSANPLEDIRNTQKITVVIARGRLFDRAALDQILLKVEAAAKRPQK